MERFLIGFHTEKKAAHCAKCGQIATDQYVSLPSPPPSLHVYTAEGAILCQRCEPTPPAKSVALELLTMYRRMKVANERSRENEAQGDLSRASDLSMRRQEEQRRQAQAEAEKEAQELARAKDEVIEEMARERLKQKAR